MTNELESYVRKVARTLHENQIARLYKIPNDVKLVGGAAIYAEQTPVDFMGFTNKGRVILLECKICKGTSLSMSQAGLKPHQWIALQEAHNAGGIGLLAWKRFSDVAVIDADIVRMTSAGRRSIRWAAIPEKYKHRWKGSHLSFFWPYLSAQTEGSDWREQTIADPLPHE